MIKKLRLSLRAQLVFAFVSIVALPTVALTVLSDRFLAEARQARRDEFVRAARDVFHEFDGERTSMRVRARAAFDSSGKALASQPSLDEAVRNFHAEHRDLFEGLLVLRENQHAFAGVAEPDPNQREALLQRGPSIIGNDRDGTWFYYPDEAQNWVGTKIDERTAVFFRFLPSGSWGSRVVNTSHGRGLATFVRTSQQKRWPEATSESDFEHWETRSEASRLSKAFDETVTRHGGLPETRGHGNEWLALGTLQLFAAGSADFPLFTTPGKDGSLPDDAQLIAAIEDADLYRGLDTLRDIRDSVTVASWAGALLIAWLLSRAYNRSIARIKDGIAAMGRGEWQQVEVTTQGALGRKLAVALNSAMQSAAATTHERESAAWLELVRNMAHEVNNTLSPIRSLAQTLPDDHKAELIVERADALAGFVARCSELARIPAPARARFDLADLVRSTIASFEALADARLVVVTDHLEPGITHADAQQIERVVVNLVKNAIEAATSHVSVRLRGDSNRLSLVIEDDGEGVAAASQAKLFVPFFTTKTGGTGLGLALSRQIVLAHGGAIELSNRAGGGAVVTVSLPAAAEATRAA